MQTRACLVDTRFQVSRRCFVTTGVRAGDFMRDFRMSGSANASHREKFRGRNPQCSVAFPFHACRSRNFRGPGYGGHGGSVLLQADVKKFDFLELEETLRAADGGNAEGTSRGLHAKDRIVKVWTSTVCFEKLSFSCFPTDE